MEKLIQWLLALGAIAAALTLLYVMWPFFLVAAVIAALSYTISYFRKKPSTP
ncbi:hypothetical protein GWN42_17855 [candidate division KSB1 bacterium]|nr:hypothetical protein [candidate division KSB1 bacterium]NIS24729.1 hypothetical protein [candidate division KSB1 bacterium]NIU25340.1 hypothetical protein [candidate division KSB1 bacterium]NIU89820.1 hypothetical protein [candidate division KSB1 bacterium]NIV94597.1 hypothetical protein [candidate division KSB1 bacterium]